MSSITISGTPGNHIRQTAVLTKNGTEINRTVDKSGGARTVSTTATNSSGATLTKNKTVTFQNGQAQIEGTTTGPKGGARAYERTVNLEKKATPPVETSPTVSEA